VSSLLNIIQQRSLEKCIDENYGEFLITLSAFEAAGLRVYDLLVSIYEGEVEIANCYVHVAGLYVILENSLGDPYLALQELSREIRTTKLASFLRGYSDVLITSGDTRTHVNSTLRSELANIKARIENSLRVLETLYESTIALILTLSLLVVMPIWSIPVWASLLVIQASGVLSYLLAFKIIKQLYYPYHGVLLIADLLYLLALPVLVVVSHAGLLSLLVLVVLHFTTRRFTTELFNIEVEVVKNFREVYSEVLLGRPLDLALIDSLSKSQLEVLRTVSFVFSRGLNGYEITRELKIPRFPRKILMLLFNPLKYSYTSMAYLSAVNTFIEELMSTRILVKEKTRMYTLHVLILALLISASYIMLSQIPVLVQGNIKLIGLYGYLGIVLLSAPIGLVRNSCYVASKISLLFTLIAIGVLTLITT